MGRSLKRRSRRTRSQQHVTKEAPKHKTEGRQKHALMNITNAAQAPQDVTKSEVHSLKKRLQDTKKQYWNERRKNKRREETHNKAREMERQARAEAATLCGAVIALNKKVDALTAEAEADGRRIQMLQDVSKDLRISRMALWKRCKRVEARRKRRKEEERRRTRPEAFRMMKKGRYSRRMRKLVHIMTEAGAADSKIGPALQKMGAALDVPITKSISSRSVGRINLERGVAADIQLAYEILHSDAGISYSSDSTSHKHIEYECRHIAVQVVNYDKPDEAPQWKLRTLGIDTSINHTSEVQVEGLKARLRSLADIFNKSPLAKREQLTFSPDDFAYRLLGTSGDHAADQKKSHELLRIWRMEVVMLRLEEEALFQLPPMCVGVVMSGLKAKQITNMGGQAVWDAMSADEQAGADLLIVQEIGQQVFNALPPDDQVKLARFVRTGCCMHKDLNCFKAGAKAMLEMWAKEKQTPPILLANIGGAKVLAAAKDRENLTAVEKEVEEGSKRGGCHMVLLGAYICHHKDKKKGQQETYDNFFEEELGYRVPFPDVTSTRYGSHGEAAAVVLIYLAIFIKFLDSIFYSKDRPGLTNLEQNFAAALKDIPTLTELAVLALYSVAVSRPFMSHVRSNDNLLQLKDYFELKLKFLQSIIENPKIWTGQGFDHEKACLGGGEWDSHSFKVFAAVQKLAPNLPHLDRAVVVFVTAARETFDERFSDEFKEGSGIDTMTDEEREKLYFASTNDVNEGGLGSWRRGQGLRPSETLHKFDASFKATRNNTESFIANKLSGEDDELYLMRQAREIDSKGLERARKAAQVAADAAKAEVNKEKEEKREEKKRKKVEILKETAKNLVLDEAGLQALKKEGLIRQLDFHRDAEKDLEIEDRIPATSNMKKNPQRLDVLKRAVARYLERNAVESDSESVPTEPDEDIEMDEP